MSDETTPDETATGATTAGDDTPASRAHDETADAPARAGEAAGDEEPGRRRFEPGPNGRGDDDVPSPLRDPLTSRRGEQSS